MNAVVDDGWLIGKKEERNGGRRAIGLERGRRWWWYSN